MNSIVALCRAPFQGHAIVRTQHVARAHLQCSLVVHQRSQLAPATQVLSPSTLGVPHVHVTLVCFFLDRPLLRSCSAVHTNVRLLYTLPDAARQETLPASQLYYIYLCRHRTCRNRLLKALQALPREALPTEAQGDPTSSHRIRVSLPCSCVRQES
jgi:hypothetical protein